MAEEIKAKLSVDTSTMDAQIAAVDQKAAAREQRLNLLKRRMEQIEANAAKLETQVQAKLGKMAKQLGKFAAISIGSDLLSDATQGNQIVGDATDLLGNVAQGAAIGGPAGAAVAAISTAVTKMFGRFKQLERDLQETRKKVIDAESKRKEFELEMNKRFKEMGDEYRDAIKRNKEESEAYGKELEYQTFLLTGGE